LRLCIAGGLPDVVKPSLARQIAVGRAAAPGRRLVTSSLSDWGFDLREAPSVLSQIVG